MFKFLENNGHPFTEDGHFIAYRSVSEDFKDFHTKSFDNKPGAVCEMPRELVDDNPNNTCSSGLHVASWVYARGFGDEGRKLVSVKVDPRDVVCVPTDYNNTKMRVSKFVVVEQVEVPHDDETVYGFKNKPEEIYEEEEEDEFDLDEEMLEEVERVAKDWANLDEVNTEADFRALCVYIRKETNYLPHEIEDCLEELGYGTSR